MGGFPPHEIIIGRASGNHRFQLMLAVFQVPGEQLLDSAAFKRCPLSIGIQVGSDRLAIHEELDGIKIERIPALKCQENCQSGIGWMQDFLLKGEDALRMTGDFGTQAFEFLVKSVGGYSRGSQQ
jgi:hypothetical protein